MRLSPTRVREGDNVYSLIILLSQEEITKLVKELDDLELSSTTTELIDGLRKFDSSENSR